MLAQTVSQAASTPEKSRSDERKRKRDVLSCLDCRRRKLKCDRGYPACSRCVKGGNASSCTYQNFHGGIDENQDELDVSAEEDGREPKRARVLNDAHQTNGPASINREIVPGNYTTSGNVSQSNVIKSLETRLATLENMLNPSSTIGNFHIGGPRSAMTTTSRLDTRRAAELETGLFKGKGVRTQYYGPSNPTSLLAHFPEVRLFMKDAHTNSSLERVQNECNLVESRMKESLRKAPSTSTNLLDLVPNRSIADRFVNLYFDTFEMTYRILHGPTFWRDYEFFWESPDQAPPGFVPVLLLVMATVRCMSPKEPLSFNHEGSTVRSEAIQWIRACDFWLTQQSHKHRFLAIYQVKCLRHLAASANSLKVKEAYTRVEDLLNYFKAAGMHRDPNLLADRCSPYEMEMRRRLWATVMELELQASIDRGMPSSLAGFTFDCPPPLNINDENFVEQSVKLPVAKPSEVYTKTSFLDISSHSLSLRISLCSLVNDPSYSMPFSDVLEFDQQINEMLESIPDWAEHDTTQVSTLLDLQLRQLLLLIHTPIARRKDSSQSRYSRMVCLETAKHLLDQHYKLISSDNFTISLVREDVYRAALSICHNTFLCSLIPNDMFFQAILSSFPKTLEVAFKVLEERCMRRGEGFQYYWHLSAAFGFVQSKLGNESFENMKFQAADRIAKVYHRVLAFQEGPEKPATILPSAAVPRIEGTSVAPNSWFYSTNSLGFTNNERGGQLSYPNAFDYSDWTLDNLWPMDGQQIAPDLNFLG